MIHCNLIIHIKQLLSGILDLYSRWHYTLTGNKSYWIISTFLVIVSLSHHACKEVFSHPQPSQNGIPHYRRISSLQSCNRRETFKISVPTVAEHCHFDECANSYVASKPWTTRVPHWSNWSGSGTLFSSQQHWNCLCLLTAIPLIFPNIHISGCNTY